jgi:hypothetical protein
LIDGNKCRTQICPAGTTYNTILKKCVRDPTFNSCTYDKTKQCTTDISGNNLFHGGNNSKYTNDKDGNIVVINKIVKPGTSRMTCPAPYTYSNYKCYGWTNACDYKIYDPVTKSCK